MIIIIAGPQLTPALRQRFGSDQSVALFSEFDALRALHEILTRRPALIALDPEFVATSRGATLIARVRADAELAAVDLRVLMIVDRVMFSRVLEESGSAVEEAIRSVSDPLDWCGTRRAARFAMTPDAPATVNGEASQLVNLSATGVQLVSPARLRPAQTFRLTLQHKDGDTRLHAIVAWCALQGSTGAPTYRAGAAFVESGQQVIEAYCQQYGRNLDRLFTVPHDKHNPSALADPNHTVSSKERVRCHAG